ncbi:MAG: GNAT family N-acetyltransferase [Bacteroidota bacterium]
MTRHSTATLLNPIGYDNCLISACLKKLFCGTSTKNKTEESEYTISNHVADVKEDLEKLNKSGLLELSYAYLAKTERSVGVKTRYIVVHRKGEPVLFAYFQLFTLTSDNFNLKKDAGFVKGIFRFFLDLKKVKVLITGNGLRNETPCCCYDESELSKNEATEIIAAAAEKIAADEHAAAVILKDIPVSAHAKKWLTGMAYNAPWEDKVMAMAVSPSWKNLQDYIGNLSRKYKTRANKILAAGADLTINELTDKEVHQHEARIDQLFRQVIDNQSFVLTRPAPSHFTDLKKLYGDAFEVIGFFHKDELVAFYTAFVTDDAYELYYVGFDYSHNTQYQLYFNLLFSGLERAILRGKHLLKLGRTSFDAKASLGAKPTDIDYFIKTVNIPSAVSKWFINYFSSMEDSKWKQRSPLKEA